MNHTVHNKGLTTSSDVPTIPEEGHVISRYTSQLTAPELSLIRDKHYSAYSYFGPLQCLAPHPEEFQSWSTKTVKGNFLPQIKSFLEYVHAFLARHFPEYDHYHFNIRTSKGSDEFLLPRWHSDGSFFLTRRPEEQQWKFVTTILGPATLFLKDGVLAREIETREQDATFEAYDKLVVENDSEREAEERRLDQEKRERVAEMFNGRERIQASWGECARFGVARGKSAVHSEPDSRGDRIFVSVLPGRETELREMAKAWNRPWGHTIR